MKFLIFDIEYTGHHIEYIQHLINYIIDYDKTNNTYHFVIHPKLKQHLVINTLSNNERIEIHYISQDEYNLLFQFKPKIKPFDFYKLLNRYADKIKPDVCILLMLTYFILPLALLKPKFKIYGVLYSSYARDEKIIGFTNKYKYLKAKLIRYLAFNNKSLVKIFVANDIKGIELLNNTYHTSKAYYLPDPVNILTSNKHYVIRNKFNISSDKYIYLHIGSIRKTKGTFEILEALNKLPNNIASKICIIIAGKPQQSISIKLNKKINEIKNVQIVYINNFIDDNLMKALFDQTNIVLMPYKNHNTSSGILGLAIAANKPVIGPSRGLLGDLIKEYWVGELINKIDESSILSAIINSYNNSYTLKNNKYYLQKHSSINFAKALLS